jgi:hypothetical protein
MLALEPLMHAGAGATDATLALEPLMHAGAGATDACWMLVAAALLWHLHSGLSHSVCCGRVTHRVGTTYCYA